MSEEKDTEGEFKAERLKALLAAVPNLSEFSRISGISRKMLERYRSGMEPSLGKAMQIAKALKLPLDALVYDVDVPTAPSNVPDAADSFLIPMLNVQAGSGAGVANSFVEVVDRLPFSAALLREMGVKPENAHFIRNKGDSNEPTIPDGAIVLVDASRRRIRDEGFYALVVDGDVLIKRVQKSVGGGITLISDNPRYAPEAVYSPETLKVEGKVFWTGGGL